MALQIALDATQSGIGVAVPAAYARVVQLNWTSTAGINAGTLNFTLEWHYDNAARQAGARPINGSSHSIPSFNWPNDRTLIKAIYDWCKTQPDFLTALDV
jgi:hypothetical protein